MFDFVRSHTRLFQGILVLLIFPSFVFFGVQGYSSFNDEANADVAVVDGRGIRRQEVEQAHQRNVERMRRQMPGLDARMLDTPEMRKESVDALVRERVLLAAAQQQHLQPADDRLLAVFQRDPQYAMLRNADGSVNKEVLAQQGLSSELFSYQLRQEVGMRQVLGGVSGSAMAPKVVAETALNAFLQRREVQLQRFDAKDYRSKINPSDADLEAFYKANSAQFKSAEQADIEYVVFDLETLKKGVQVKEEDARKFYDENASRYTAAEERRASHILLKADKDTSSADKAKAKTAAEAVLADLRRNPGGFADAARKHSQDSSNAANGGDLDFFGRGMMTKAFEDAAFAMKQGEISNLVETEFGFHIIQLTGVRGGTKKPFEAVRAEIEDEVRSQLARKAFQQDVESFNNTVYEQPDSLQPVIDKFKLSKRTATVQRQPAPGAIGPLASPKLLELVFGADAVQKKRNTDSVEVAPNTMAAARVLKHTPERVLALAEVKPQIMERVLATQAAAAAAKDGKAKLEALKAKDAELPVTAVLSRTKPEGQPRSVLDEVLRADATKLPQVLGVDLGEQGYVVLRVTKLLPREEQPGGDAALVAQVASFMGNAEGQAYVAALKRRMKVEVKPAAYGTAASAPAR